MFADDLLNLKTVLLAAAIVNSVQTMAEGTPREVNLASHLPKVPTELHETGTDREEDNPWLPQRSVVTPPVAVYPPKERSFAARTVKL
jgi:hypothetical protein